MLHGRSQQTWFEVALNQDCTTGEPGIYVWLIDNVPIYAGKSVNLMRRIRQYLRNVERIENGRNCHIAGRAFRRVHIDLAEAKANGRQVRVEIVENCTRETLNARERHHQKRLGL
jgi:hypothetical protein